MTSILNEELTLNQLTKRRNEIEKLKDENINIFYDAFFKLIECYKTLNIIDTCINCPKDFKEVEKCSKSNELFNFIYKFIRVLKKTYSENKEVFPILIDLFDNILMEIKVVENLKCESIENVK